MQVSIITPLWNGAATIRACLDSVADQGIDGVEHLVIDNRSTDDGPAIAAQAGARLLSCPHRQGAAAARNVGLAAARGRWVAFLDADDRFLPGKLARQIAAMQARELAFSWTSYRVARPGRPPRDQITPATATLPDLLSKRIVIGCSTVMLDRAALGAHRFDESLALAEDFALWQVLARDCARRGLGIGALPEVLTEYRAGTGISAGKLRAAKAHWAALRSLDLSRPRAARAMADYIRHALRDRLP